MDNDNDDNILEQELKTIKNLTINDEKLTPNERKLNKLKNNIFNTDCIIGMKKIPNESVDCVIADPPYNIGKDFGNDSDCRSLTEYIKWCKKWIKECLRILKPSGTFYIYGFSEILASIRFNITCNVRWIIWHYTNKTIPKLNFWQRSHESILVCWKDSYIFNTDDVREEYTDNYKKASGKTRKNTNGRFGNKKTTYNVNPMGALPRDVIKIPALAGGAGKKERVNHPTQKPLELCKKLLLACYNKEIKNNILVVPFCGSGSECLAGQLCGYDYIGYELNQEYIELAKKRLNGEEIAEDINEEIIEENGENIV